MIFKNFSKSIFFKILIVISIAFIFIVYSTNFVFKANQNSTHFKKMSENCINFAKMIIDSIEFPVNKEKVKSITKEFNMEIRIKKNNDIWSYPNDMREFKVDKIEKFNNKDTRIGFVNGELIVYIKKGNVEYTINLEPGMRKFSTINRSFVHLSLFFSALSLLFIYIALVWLFRPIKKLHNAIKLVSTGVFTFPLKTKRKDELGDLINSFIEMRDKIDFMVKAKEQLLLDVSHELRSPVTRIKLSLEMIENIEEKQDIRSDINEIQTMINVLLDNSVLNKGKSALKTEKTEIISLINDVYSKFNTQSIELRLKSISKYIYINTDPKWMKILFKNLISNAIKYSDSRSKSIDIEIKKDKHNLIISIRNYGIGISENDIDKIFEPFYRVEKSRSKEIEGYGLGLGICKKIMDAHEGDIKIISNVKTNVTTVELWFNIKKTKDFTSL